MKGKLESEKLTEIFCNHPTFQIMDELTEKLAGSFNVTLEQNSTAAQHPRFAQYKCKTKVDQETRRKRILEEQKKYLLNLIFTH